MGTGHLDGEGRASVRPRCHPQKPSCHPTPPGLKPSPPQLGTCAVVLSWIRCASFNLRATAHFT
eukprot:2477812-Rhodomonas_salina.1